MTEKKIIKNLHKFAGDMGLNVQKIYFNEGDAWEDPFYIIKLEDDSFHINPGSDTDMYRQMYERMVIYRADKSAAQDIFLKLMERPDIDPSGSYMNFHMIEDKIVVQYRIYKDDKTRTISVALNTVNYKKDYALETILDALNH